MADPFQPKFVDLVRNFTTTVGTGNLVLGDAASGFRSFSSALEPGDSFYYSVAGLEKTSECEVGRGTLQADGTIARQPIGGVPTNFSSGIKTVALVAAAEWFESIEALRGAPATATSRSALAGLASSGAALLTESGREGLFVFDDSDLSAKVSADSAQGIFIAPESAPTGASGAWVRQFDGPVLLDWFGAVEGYAEGANAAANDTAWAALAACLSANAVNPSWVFQSVFEIQLGYGTFEFQTPLDLNFGSVILSGRGAGHPNSGTAATTLIFHDCSGIRIQQQRTSGATIVDSAAHTNGSYSKLKDIRLKGTYANAEAEHHGVHARGVFYAENVVVENFAGDGFRIEAGDGNYGGNANNSTISCGAAIRCRDGYFSDGGDVNSVTVTGLVCSQNRRWGFYASPLINQTFVGCNASANGRTDGSFAPTMVHHGGHYYFVIAGQEAWCSANAPSGTSEDNQGWAYLGDGAGTLEQPQWTSGTAYRAGGCYRTDQSSAFVSFIGCYVETGVNQGKAQLVAKTLVVGGNLTTFLWDGSPTPAPSFNANAYGLLQSNAALQLNNGTVSTRLGAEPGDNAAYEICRFSEPTMFANGFGLRFDSATGNNALFTYNNSNNVSTYQLLITGPATTVDFGTGTAVPHAVYVPRLFVGDMRSNARQITVGSAAPASGAHAEGEFVHYRGASANLIGWKCTAAGTPGAWEQLYGLTQLQAAGSGLTASAPDKLLGRFSEGAGAIEEIACTAAGRALLEDSDAAEQRSTLGLKRGIAFHCAGPPAASEVIGGGIAPYALTLSAASSRCNALVAATAATSLVINKSGVQVGQIDFAAGAAVGTVTLTDTAVAAGDHITVHNPATADSTLADIDGLLTE